jgi:hypothetical protein
MTSLRSAVETIREHQLIQSGRRVPTKETEIPAEVCAQPSSESSYLTLSQVLSTVTPGSDGISKLPGELQEMIWRRIEPADRAALALTCKGHAAMYQELKDKRVERHGRMIRRLPRPLRINKAARLKVLVRLRTWMPAKFRLCYSCCRYLDVKKAGKVGGQWGGDKKLVENGLATEKAINQGPRCPLCVRHDQVNMTRHKQEWKKYVELGRSISFN